MKRIDIADIAQLKNELRKYKTGKKLDIRQFDQAARLAWLGLAVLSPFDPEDPDCHSWLLYLQRPQGLAEHMLVIDEDLLSQMHILDAEQGRYLASIIEQGVQERAAGLTALNRRQFYFDKFFKAEPGST